MMRGVPPTLGLVLAGGRGRRLGGVDKALVPLDGRPLLAHVIDRLAPQCTDLVLSANGDPTRFDAYGLAVVGDADGGGRGPLAGIAAGLAWLRRERSDLAWLVTAPVDCPFLPTDLVVRLHSGRPATTALPSVAEVGGRLQPAFALWPTALAAAVQAVLDTGEQGVAACLLRHGAVPVPFPHRIPDPFANLNDPDDLAAATAMLQAATQPT